MLVQLLGKDDLTIDDAITAEQKWKAYVASYITVRRIPPSLDGRAVVHRACRADSIDSRACRATRPRASLPRSRRRCCAGLSSPGRCGRRRRHSSPSRASR
jgi:hypothetical protein